MADDPLAVIVELWVCASVVILGGVPFTPEIISLIAGRALRTSPVRTASRRALTVVSHVRRDSALSTESNAIASPPASESAHYKFESRIGAAVWARSGGPELVAEPRLAIKLVQARYSERSIAVQ